MSCQGDFDASLDVHSNIVALCPNCHRAIHNATFEEKKEIIANIFNKRADNLKKQVKKINLDTEDVYNYYQ